MKAWKLLLVLVALLTSVTAAQAAPAADETPDLSENIIPQGDDPEASIAEVTTTSIPTKSQEETKATEPTPTPSGRPATVPSTLSRIINDIFQIPISVLRAINNLFTNAFNPSKN